MELLSPHRKTAATDEQLARVLKKHDIQLTPDPPTESGRQSCSFTYCSPTGKRVKVPSVQQFGQPWPQLSSLLGDVRHKVLVDPAVLFDTIYHDPQTWALRHNFTPIPEPFARYAAQADPESETGIQLWVVQGSPNRVGFQFPYRVRYVRQPYCLPNKRERGQPQTFTKIDPDKYYNTAYSLRVGSDDAAIGLAEETCGMRIKGAGYRYGFTMPMLARFLSSADEPKLDELATLVEQAHETRKEINRTHNQ